MNKVSTNYGLTRNTAVLEQEIAKYSEFKKYNLQKISNNFRIP